MYSKVTHLHRSILLAANGSISFVFMANIPLCVCMYIIKSSEASHLPTGAYAVSMLCLL